MLLDHRWRRLSWTSAAWLAMAGAALATQVVSLTLEQAVQASSEVIVGKVVSAQSRWGDATRRFMLTDYTVDVEQTVTGSGANRIVLTYWGGTIGNETQRMEGVSRPTVGRRYVLMLRGGWAGSRGSPLVGLDQGLFTVEADAVTGTERVLDRNGRAVRRAGAGLAALASAASEGETATLQEFVAWIRSVPPKAGPSPLDVPLTTAGSRVVMPTIRLRPELPGETLPAAALESRAPQAPARARPPLPAAGDGIQATATGQPEVLSRGELGAAYSWSGPATTPIIVNQFPASFAPWSPEDQYQMSKWNTYATDAFRVFVTPTGTYGWPNDRFDLAGWPTSADLQAVYGSPWDPGTLGITFSRSTDHIIEADIALNPAYTWTLSDEAVFNGSGVFAFRRTMLHELGHMWGLQHNFDFLSVMNYSPAVYRAWGVPFMDDAEAIRTAYPARAVARTDLGVYLFRSAGTQWWTESGYPSTAIAGDYMFVDRYHVENAGTTTITNPVLHWYLTSLRSYSGSVWYMGDTTIGVTLPRFTYVNPLSVGSWLPVPIGMDGGLYYLNALSELSGGASQGSFPFAHNAAWSQSRIRILPAMAGIDGGRYSGGTAGNAWLYLVGLTDGSGLDLSIESSDPAVVSVAPTLHVGPFTRQASILVRTSAVDVRRDVLLTARNGTQSTTGVVVVLPASKISVPSKQGQIGQSITLKATLRQSATGAPIAGATVTFQVSGDTRSFNAVTTADGIASVKYPIPPGGGPGSRVITATFAGDADHGPVAGIAPLTVAAAKVKITVAAATATRGTTASLSAKLKRATDAVPIPGAPLVFTVLGRTYSATTDATGKAVVAASIPSATAIGTYPITVTFAGDTLHQSGTGTGTLTVKQP